jgi:hypothetical protein
MFTRVPARFVDFRLPLIPASATSRQDRPGDAPDRRLGEAITADLLLYPHLPGDTVDHLLMSRNYLRGVSGQFLHGWVLCAVMF